MSSPVHQHNHDNAATCTVMVTVIATAIQECVHMETQTLVHTTLATDCDVSAEACHNCHANHSCASHYQNYDSQPRGPHPNYPTSQALCSLWPQGDLHL